MAVAGADGVAASAPVGSRFVALTPGPSVLGVTPCACCVRRESGVPLGSVFGEGLLTPPGR